jgi:hypothetical protein
MPIIDGVSQRLQSYLVFWRHGGSTVAGLGFLGVVYSNLGTVVRDRSRSPVALRLTLHEHDARIGEARLPA